jgi:hypothetical protein
MHQGALALIDVEEEQRLSPTARSKRGRPNAKPLKMVTPNRGHTTTVSDLLANRWQTAVEVAPGIDQGGYKTRPGLLFWGGAPRRNRTGDPILTMNLAATAVRTSVSAGRRRP